MDGNSSSLSAFEQSSGHSTRPVFLVGCHRSGTTLLRYILNAHRNIACPPEAKLLTALFKVTAHPQTMLAMRSLGISPKMVLVELGQVASRLLEAYATTIGKPRWVDKTPNYYTILDRIDEMFEHNAQYLFLVRHPFDVIASLEEFFGSPSEFHGDPEIARVAERYGYGRFAWMKYWIEVTERILFAKEMFESRALVLRYEDLVMHPAETVSGIFSFLDEPQDPDAVANAFHISQDEGYQDWKIQQSRGIHDKSVYRGWHAMNTGERATVWRFTRELSESLGYTANARYDEWGGYGRPA